MFNKVFTKVLIVFIIFSVLPTLAAGLLVMKDAEAINHSSVDSLKLLGQRAASVSDKALEDLGKTIIDRMAQGAAKECEYYLQLHPALLKKTTPKNRRALYNDKGFRAHILDQRIGNRGLVVLYENDGLIWVSPKAEDVGKDLSALTGKSQQMSALLNNSLKSKETNGIYDWVDPDGQTRKKYVSCSAVTNTPFIVAVTTYTDEFTAPVKQIRDEFQNQGALVIEAAKKYFQTKGTQGRIFLVFFAVLIIGAGLLYLIVSIETKAFADIAELMKKVSAGDINIKVSEELKNRTDELGEIANSLEKMASSMKHMQTDLGEK